MSVCVNAGIGFQAAQAALMWSDMLTEQALWTLAEGGVGVYGVEQNKGRQPLENAASKRGGRWQIPALRLWSISTKLLSCSWVVRPFFNFKMRCWGRLVRECRAAAKPSPEEKWACLTGWKSFLWLLLQLSSSRSDRFTWLPVRSAYPSLCNLSWPTSAASAASADQGSSFKEPANDQVVVFMRALKKKKKGGLFIPNTFSFYCTPFSRARWVLETSGWLWNPNQLLLEADVVLINTEAGQIPKLTAKGDERSLSRSQGSPLWQESRWQFVQITNPSRASQRTGENSPRELILLRRLPFFFSTKMFWL